MYKVNIKNVYFELKDDTELIEFINSKWFMRLIQDYEISIEPIVE